MLLKHFNQILPSDIGGHDQCCDNCRRKLVFIRHKSCNIYTHSHTHSHTHTHTHTHIHYQNRIRRDVVDSTNNNTTYSNEAKLLLEVVDVRLFSYADMLYVYIFKGN